MHVITERKYIFIVAALHVISFNKIYMLLIQRVYPYPAYLILRVQIFSTDKFTTSHVSVLDGQYCDTLKQVERTILNIWETLFDSTFLSYLIFSQFSLATPFFHSFLKETILMRFV